MDAINDQFYLDFIKEKSIYTKWLKFKAKDDIKQNKYKQTKYIQYDVETLKNMDIENVLSLLTDDTIDN